MENFIFNFIKYFIILSLIGIIKKFMSKSRDEEENITNSDVVVFILKKNAKLMLYISSFVFIIVFPAISINTIIKDKEIGLLICNIIMILIGIFLLYVIKYEKMIYKNGEFRNKNIFGKTRIYKFDDVIKAKYINGNNGKRIILYFKDNRKLPIESFHTNFDWVLKEIKIRKIEIYNK